MPPKRPTSIRHATADGGAESASSDQARAGAANETPSSASKGVTPSPAPPKRLDSITRSASASGRGSRPTATPKPKFAGRRSQAARAVAEQAEAKKKAAEADAAAAEARNNALDARRFGYGGRGDRGGRGLRGGRGRGGHMGDSHRLREEAVASGPFSAGKVSSGGTARRSGGVAGAGAGGGSGAVERTDGPSSSSTRYTGGGGSSSSRSNGVITNVKSESSMDDAVVSGTRLVKTEDGGYISSEDERTKDEGPKQNIDHMQLVDLTGEGEGMNNHLLVPVRLTRVPHRERVVGLNAEETDDSSDARENPTFDRKRGKQRARDLEVTGVSERPRRPTAYSSSDSETESHIKEEPMDDDLQTRPTTSEPHVATTTSAALREQQGPPSSPESKRKAKARIKATVDSSLQDEDDFPMPPEPKFQTEAEKEEWSRKYMDLRSVRNELGLLIPKAAEQQALDANGDTIMSEVAPAAERVKQQQLTRERNVYLFQFPPVLPDLTPIVVKEDPEGTDLGSASGTAMDVDQEPSTDIAANSHDKKESEFQSKQPSLPTGSVGKLKIHKSGKATLDWGGTSLSLGMGAEATFLQDVMIAKLPEQKPKDDAVVADQEPAIGMGMGLIRGKFVLTPNWEEILG